MLDSILVGLLTAGSWALSRKVDRKATALFVWNNRRFYTASWYFFYYAGLAAFLASIYWHVWEGVLYFGWASWWMNRKKPEIDNGSAFRKMYVKDASQ